MNILTDRELDHIYDLVDEFMKNEKWDFLSDINDFLILNVEKYDVMILITWATVTLPGKSEIKNRSVFIEKCKQLHSDTELWKGLD